MTKKQISIVLGGILIVFLFGLLPNSGVRPEILARKDLAVVADLTLQVENLVSESANAQTSLSQSFANLSHNLNYKKNSAGDIFLVQMKDHFENAGIPLRIESAPEFMLYSYKTNDEVKWIIWLDPMNTNEHDLTANFPATGSLARTERFINPNESEPLKRGYLIEDDNAKILVSIEPMFISIEK